MELNAGMIAFLEETRNGIRTLDPEGDQSREEVRQVVAESIRVYEELVAELLDRFNGTCLS